MKMNSKTPPTTKLVFLFQDYDMIDYEILQYEKKKEEMELQGHVFCSMCSIEINITDDLCNRCEKQWTSMNLQVEAPIWRSS